MEITQVKNSPVYIFGKDQYGRFMFCNDPFAEIIGADSPTNVTGKTDFQTCWRSYAEFYRKGDLAVMAGNIWQNVAEKQTHIDGITRDIIVSKYPFFDKDGMVRGVVGSYYTKVPSKNTDTIIRTSLICEKDKIYLGTHFGNEYFTKREYEVFKQLLLSKSMKQIAVALNISSRTAKSHVNKIKIKLQCSYKNDIVITAVRFGLVALQN